LERLKIYSLYEYGIFPQLKLNAKRLSASNDRPEVKLKLAKLVENTAEKHDMFSIDTHKKRERVRLAGISPRDSQDSQLNARDGDLIANTNMTHE